MIDWEKEADAFLMETEYAVEELRSHGAYNAVAKWVTTHFGLTSDSATQYRNRKLHATILKRSGGWKIKRLTNCESTWILKGDDE